MNVNKRMIMATILISVIIFSIPTGSSNNHLTQDIQNLNYENYSLFTCKQDLQESIYNLDKNFNALGNEAVTFVNVSVEANLSQHRGKFFAWADYNNDGYQDLLVDGKKLLRNNGPPGWNFTDVTKSCNIVYSGSINVGVWGDWNNDRYLDFYAAGGGWTTDNPTTYDVLWRNNGPPNYDFEDYTLQAGSVRDSYPSVAAGWGDFDNDGWIDLYVANYENTGLVGYPDTLWHNNGDETFTEISTISKIRQINARPGRGVAWCDYNNDGWNDIYISNYRITGNTLWENQHNGTFINVAPEKNCQGLVHEYQDYPPYYGHTIGSSWADLDNNGLMDIWVSNLVHKYVGGGDIRGYICDDSNIYSNLGGQVYNFTDIRGTTGISYKPVGGQGVYQGDELWSGVAIGDYDNDGDLDVFVPQIYDLNYANSFLFRNNNDGTFTDMAASLGLRCYNTYGAAWCDYNNDGFLDLITGGKCPFIAEGSGSYEIHLFKNNGNNNNNWLKIKLGGIESNTIGIGAKVSLKTSQGTQCRQIEGGTGSHSQQNSFIAHFGIGSASTVGQVNVEWPSGRGIIFHNIPANQDIELIEEQEGPEITSFSVSNNNINEDDTITFSGSATIPIGSIEKYEWDFNGDGSFDWSSTSTANTNYEYNKSGKYYAKLRVWDDTGRYYTDKASNFIYVNNVPPEVPKFNNIIKYEDELVIFNASTCIDTPSDLPHLEFNWSFGDGSYTGWIKTKLTNHSYSENGNYEITLQVRDDDNDTNSTSFSVIIKNQIPSCVLTYNTTTIEDEILSLSVEGFDSPSDISTLLYLWDFGDGDKTFWSAETNIQHSYTEMGIYNIKCYVRDDDWPKDENYTAGTIVVYNIVPTCNTSVSKTVFEDELLTFNTIGNDTKTDKTGLQYLWDFGDGATTDWLYPGSQNVTHVYTEQGIYTSSLLVKDDNDAFCIEYYNITVSNVEPSVVAMAEEDQIDIDLSEDQIITFYGEGMDSESDLSTLRYSWNFGVLGLSNTTWSRSPEFEFSYKDTGEYKAVLTVRDDNGATANASIDVMIENMEPIPRFIVSDYSVSEDELILFDATDTEDTKSDLPILNYTWDLGDDSDLRYDISFSYVFTISGEYRVKLKVTDDNGASESVTQKIKVKNEPPKAEILASSTQAFTGTAITFNGKESWDTKTDRQNLIYNWDFGDRKSDTSELVIHRFYEAKVYRVKLTVTDDNGASSTNEISIKITEPEDSQSNGDGDEAEGSIFGLVVGLNVILIIILILLILYTKRGYIPYILPKKGDSQPNGLEQDDVSKQTKDSNSNLGKEQKPSQNQTTKEPISPPIPMVPPMPFQPMPVYPPMQMQLQMQRQVPTSPMAPMSSPTKDMGTAHVQTIKQDIESK
jgi:PKD repeat protein